MKLASTLAAAVCLTAATAAPTKNIVELAVSVPDLSTLVTAVTAGKLVDTLSSAGPFTVFAPTNEAFAKVPNATLAHLLDPANIKELDSVLTYHVLPEAVQSKDLKPFQSVKTVEGSELYIIVDAKGVYVGADIHSKEGSGHVTAADNEATNGVVHIIDGVLLPLTKAVGSAAAPTKNIVALAQSVPDLSTLVTAVVAGKLVDTLSSAGPFTVFAPTNEAFAKVPNATLAHLLDPANIKELDSVLTYHVVSGNIQSKDLKPFQDVKTVEGSEIRVVVHNSKVYVNQAQVTAPDNEATNGVVHIIDGVLIPYKEAVATLA
jgi:transforming growth factor-beta-induced protein